MPDALAYVARAHELWATTPAEQSIKIVSLAGGSPLVAASITLEGSPECEAVDDARGLVPQRHNRRPKTRLLVPAVGRTSTMGEGPP